MNRILPAAILAFFIYLLHAFVFPYFPAPRGKTTLALGFIILTAYLVGAVMERFNLPQITGYMLTGVFFGPQVLGLLPREAVQDLKLIDSIALGLIAFSAGREMNIRYLRNYLASILSLTFWITLCEALGIGWAVWYFSARWEPLMVPEAYRLPLALVFGLLAMAKSPITTIAIIDETGIRNKLTYTVLGVVIAKDILLIVCFSLVSGFIKQWVSPGSVSGLRMTALLSWKLLGSIGGGVLLGALIILYLRRINLELSLFIVATAFLTTEFSHQVGLDPLLLCMSAGVFIENFSPEGDSFLQGLKPASPIIYTLFFAIAGAHLDLVALGTLWWVVGILLLLRTALTQTGITIANYLTDRDPQVQRFAWMGMINQAGVTLVIALYIGRTVPEIGGVITPIALGMIAATDFFAPTLFKMGLRSSIKQEEKNK